MSCNCATTASNGKPTIALVLKTLNNPCFIDMQKGAQFAADKLGVSPSGSQRPGRGLRLKGFREVIAKHPEMPIVSSQTANWERDQGFNVFQNMLQAHYL